MMYRFFFEIYRNCVSLHKATAACFAAMAERNHIPVGLRSRYIGPVGEAGKDPSSCANRRPIALLSRLIKLMKLALVRRMTPGPDG